MTNYVNEVYDMIREVSPETSRKSKELFQRFTREHDKPVVTLFGFDGTGKTSLIKRLCVENARDVPEELTISGRPETFETTEVELDNVILRDTPGLRSSGDGASFATRVRECIALTDVMIIPVQNKFFAGNRDLFEDYLKPCIQGEPFMDEGWSYSDEVLNFALSRVDEVAVGPERSPEQFNDFVNDRLDDLRNYIQDIGVDASGTRFFPVAGDPFSQTKNNPNPDRELYESYTDWDGIDELYSWLNQLDDDFERLRDRAELRFALFQLSNQKSELKEGLQELDEEGLENRKSELETVREGLADIENQIVERVDDLKEEIIRTNVPAGRSIPDSLPEKLEKSLSNKFSEQARNWKNRLHRTVKPVDDSVQEHSAPNQRVDTIIVESLSPETPEEPPDISAWHEVARQLGGMAKNGAREWLQHDIGTNYDEIVEEIEQFHDADSFEAFKKNLDGNPVLENAEHAEKISKFVGALEIADRVGPALDQAAEMLAEHIEENRRRQLIEEAKSDLRDEISRAIEQPISEFRHNWLNYVDDLADRINKEISEVNKTLEESANKREQIQNQLKCIEELQDELMSV